MTSGRIGLVAIGMVLAGLATWYAAWGAASGDGEPPTPAATTTPPSATTSVAAFVPLLSYPGHRAGDVVAGTTGALSVDGAQVQLSAPVVSPSLTGHLFLCVHVSVRTQVGRLGDQAVNWAVRTPTGFVEHPARSADDALVAKGQLVPGDHVSGRLCFNEPGTGGLYILSYSPRPANAVQSRGVWLMRLLGS